MRKSLLAGLLAISAIYGTGAFPFDTKAAHAQSVYDSIAAVVNGAVITKSDIRNAKKQFGKDLSDESILHKLVEKQLQISYAQSKNIEISETEINAAVEDIKIQNKLTDNMFEQALNGEGFSLAGYKEQLREEMTLLKLHNLEILSRVIIDEEEIKDYYETHKNDFRVNEKREISQIFLAVSENENEEEIKNKGTLILEKLQAGEKFESLAFEYSDDISGEHGGKLGTFSKGELNETLDNAAFELAEGETGKLVRSLAGFHIIRVDKILSQGSRTFEEASREIRKLIEMQKSTAIYNEWINKLRTNAYIEYK